MNPLARINASNLANQREFKKGNDQMKASHCMFVASALIASTQVTAAQGTSGGSGAAASIPGSVVRGHEQGPGLFSILTNATPTSYNPSSTQRTPRPGNGEGLPKPVSK
jgi:hypothetical protein